MTFISVTRLRLRSIRFLPGFVPHAVRSRTQAACAPGFQGGALLMDRLAFWTLTGWDARESMRAYMRAGPHRTAMPRLAGWCDEASVVHWEQDGEALPAWPEAVRRMREEGRPSPVRHPSAEHADLTFRTPPLAGSATIRPQAPKEASASRP